MTKKRRNEKKRKRKRKRGGEREGRRKGRGVEKELIVKEHLEIKGEQDGRQSLIIYQYH